MFNFGSFNPDQVSGAYTRPMVGQGLLGQPTQTRPMVPGATPKEGDPNGDQVITGTYNDPNNPSNVPGVTGVTPAPGSTGSSTATVTPGAAPANSQQSFGYQPGSSYGQSWAPFQGFNQQAQSAFAPQGPTQSPNSWNRWNPSQWGGMPVSPWPNLFGGPAQGSYNGPGSPYAPQQPSNPYQPPSNPYQPQQPQQPSYMPPSQPRPPANPFAGGMGGQQVSPFNLYPQSPQGIYNAGGATWNGQTATPYGAPAPNPGAPSMTTPTPGAPGRPTPGLLGVGKIGRDPINGGAMSPSNFAPVQGQAGDPQLLSQLRANPAMAGQLLQSRFQGNQQAMNSWINATNMGTAARNWNTPQQQFTPEQLRWASGG